MSSFSGWEMPIKYSSIIEEHMAVRNRVGIFDISHMGELLIRGDGAACMLQELTSNDVTNLGIGDAQYSTVLNEKGGVKDDIFIYRIKDQEYLLVVNSINTSKIHDWFKKNTGDKNSIKDITDEVIMLAVQGPESQKVVQGLTDFNLDELERFKIEFINLAGIEVFVSRSGYTGEDGFEIYILDQLHDSSYGEKLWGEILLIGEEFDIKPCGLGARDSLRLEEGFTLYGHELTEEITPLEARIGFTVKFYKDHFIGKEYLQRQKMMGINQRRVGLKIEERGIPREGHKLIFNGMEVGVVTSGGFSPILRSGIAMGYLSINLNEGDEVKIKIRGNEKKARIINWPFYNKE